MSEDEYPNVCLMCSAMGEESARHPLYHVGISIWILFGLAWLSAIINSMQDVLTHTVEEHTIPLKMPAMIIENLSRRKNRIAASSIEDADAVRVTTNGTVTREESNESKVYHIKVSLIKAYECNDHQ